MNEKGYDAVFAEQWKAELSECDIDPEAVSVGSEAHDMENGRDGLDGNAPEKDATASRNGLSRNQMGIEEKAAECKEAATVLANGNAL